jgi:hypothetical protein
VGRRNYSRKAVASIRIASAADIGAHAQRREPSFLDLSLSGLLSAVPTRNRNEMEGTRVATTQRTGDRPPAPHA